MTTGRETILTSRRRGYGRVYLRQQLEAQIWGRWVFTYPTMIQIGWDPTTFSILESSRQIITTTIYQAGSVARLGRAARLRKKNRHFCQYLYGRGERRAGGSRFLSNRGKYIVSGIYKVTDAEGSSQFGRRRRWLPGRLVNAGYYTVLLDKTVTLEAGERFAVIVEITRRGAIHPVAIEHSSSDKGTDGRFKRR